MKILPQGSSFSYKTAIIKCAISLLMLLGFTFITIISDIQLSKGVRYCFGVILLLSLYLLFGSVADFISTHENKKLFRLKKINPYYIKSETTLKLLFFEMFESKDRMFVIIKNQQTVLKAGCDIVMKSERNFKTGLREVDYKYYYIDKIKGNRIERVKIRNFEMFKENLNHFNGYNSTFEVVSINRIDVPKIDRLLD